MPTFIAPPGVTKVMIHKWGGPEGESVMVADVRRGQEILPAEVAIKDAPPPKLTTLKRHPPE